MVKKIRTEAPGRVVCSYEAGWCSSWASWPACPPPRARLATGSSWIATCDGQVGALTSHRGAAMGSEGCVRGVVPRSARRARAS